MRTYLVKWCYLAAAMMFLVVALLVPQEAARAICSVLAMVFLFLGLAALQTRLN